MAESKLTAKPLTPDQLTDPTTEQLIAARLLAEQQRIFQALGIVQTVKKVLDQSDGLNETLDLQPLWWSLWTVEQILNDIAGAIEPSVALEPEVAPHG